MGRILTKVATFILCEVVITALVFIPVVCYLSNGPSKGNLLLLSTPLNVATPSLITIKERCTSVKQEIPYNSYLFVAISSSLPFTTTSVSSSESSESSSLPFLSLPMT